MGRASVALAAAGAGLAACAPNVLQTPGVLANPNVTPPKETLKIDDLYSSLVRSADANYFISQKYAMKPIEPSGSKMAYQKTDGISNIYRWTDGGTPELIEQVGALTSNLAPNPNGGITFAAQGEIFTLPPDSRQVTSIYKLATDFSVKDATTTPAERLRQMAAEYVNSVAVSPSGQIAFVANDESLYILENGHKRRLTPEGESVNPSLGQLVYSSDGKEIAYVRMNEDGLTWNIETITVDGKNSRQAAAKNSEQPAWKPDGRGLAWIQGEGAYAQTANIPQPIKLNKVEQLDPRSVAWSPDGRIIAFIANEGTSNPAEKGGAMIVTESALFVASALPITMGAHGHEPVKLVTDGISGFVWTADNTISYIANENNGSSVKTVTIGR